MHASIVTIFPDLFKSWLDYGVISRALVQKYFSIDFVNPRDFSLDPNRRIDAKPYGGGAGMVMQAKPIVDAVNSINKTQPCLVISMTPEGKRLEQKDLVELYTNYQHLIFIAGRYEGIDERVNQLVVDRKYSIGDFIVTGGELPIMLCLEGLLRLIPGVLGNNASLYNESFGGDKPRLDSPSYTRPAICYGLEIPRVLKSGDHVSIDKWRKRESLYKTWLLRPDLLELQVLDQEEAKWLAEFSEEKN